MDDSDSEGEVEDVREFMRDLELDTVDEDEAAAVNVGGRGVPEPDDEPDSVCIVELVTETDEHAESDGVLLKTGDTDGVIDAETVALEQAVNVGFAVPVASPEREDEVDGEPVRVATAESEEAGEIDPELVGVNVDDVDSVELVVLVIVSWIEAVPLGDDVADGVSFAECVTLCVTEPDTESLGIVVAEPEIEGEPVDVILRLTVFVTDTVADPENTAENVPETEPVADDDLTLVIESCIDGEGVDEGEVIDVSETVDVIDDTAVNVGEELWVGDTEAVPVTVCDITEVAECEGEEEGDMSVDGEFDTLVVTDAVDVLLKRADAVFVAQVVREPDGDGEAVLFESVADDDLEAGAEMV